jgi:predicted negative regulator of RcsB-dependent stress response
VPPQLIFLALIGAGVWAGYRWYKKESARIRSELKKADEELKQRDKKSIPTLKLDPETGEYRPTDD